MVSMKPATIAALASFEIADIRIPCSINASQPGAQISSCNYTRIGCSHVKAEPGNGGMAQKSGQVQKVISGATLRAFNTARGYAAPAEAM
jgi:hypothetical protein